MLAEHAFQQPWLSRLKRGCLCADALEHATWTGCPHLQSSPRSVCPGEAVCTLRGAPCLPKLSSCMTGAATIMSPVHSRSTVSPPDGAAVPVYPCTTPPWPNQHMALTTEYPFSNDDSSHNLLNLQHQCTIWVQGPALVYTWHVGPALDTCWHGICGSSSYKCDELSECPPAGDVSTCFIPESGWCPHEDSLRAGLLTQQSCKAALHQIDLDDCSDGNRGPAKIFPF